MIPAIKVENLPDRLKVQIIILHMRNEEWLLNLGLELLKPSDKRVQIDLTFAVGSSNLSLKLCSN